MIIRIEGVSVLAEVASVRGHKEFGAGASGSNRAERVVALAEVGPESTDTSPAVTDFSSGSASALTRGPRRRG